MKKSIKSLLLGAVVAVTTVSLVACAVIPPDMNSELGLKLPKGINPTHSINSSMSALEMYEAGLANYNDVEYVGSHQKGQITSKTIGLNTVQSLSSYKIQDNGSYFLDSETYTVSGLVKVHFVDQLRFGNGECKVRSANEFAVEDSVGSVLGWNAVESYPDIATAVKKYPNDPTRMNMFIVNESTVNSSTAPVFDAKTGQYTFTMDLNVATATTDYVKNMEYNMSNNSMTAGAEITFTDLSLEVVMWENGLIKSVSSDESYELPVMGTTKTNLKAKMYFTYDSKELTLDSRAKF